MRWIPILGLVLALLLAGVANAAPNAELQPPLLPPERASVTTDLHDPFSARTDVTSLSAELASRSADPDLRDPFQRRKDLHDPSIARAAAAIPSDLHDPFARRPTTDREPPPSDLRDPFATDVGPRSRRHGSRSNPRSSPPAEELGLKDPFRAPTAQVPTPASPGPRRTIAADVEPTTTNLKNPFTRRTPPVKSATPSVAPLRPLRAPAVRLAPRRSAPDSVPVPLQRPRHAAPSR